MSYCLNPSCSEPRNPGQTKVCQTCGSKILLRNRYLSAKKIGKGGFGATFLAVDLSLPGTPLCVIKQLRPSIDDPSVIKMARELFDREAKTLGKIGNHPQIPRLLDYFEDGQQFYLIQEFVDGNNLQQEIKTNGAFSEAGVRQFLSEMLPLLQFIHSQRVIHRDIKPANIIRRDIDKKLVLIDFGAVKNEIDTLAASNTLGNSVNTSYAIGTLGFAAPEQLAMRPTYASDIYAVGVTAIYLLTAKSPKDFVNPSTGEFDWENHVEISASLSRVLKKMLQISLANRYKSAKEALEALDMEPYNDSLAQSMLVNLTGERLAGGTEKNDSPDTTVGSRQSMNARLAQEIRARNMRKKKFVGDTIPPSANNVGGVLNGKTTIQNNAKLQGMKLPPKLDGEVIIDFYSKGWRDFAQRAVRNLVLRKAILSGSNFHQSQLSNANFFGSNLSKVDFGRADLSGAVLKNTNLTDAYLAYCNLENADLRGADLTGAHLNHANLTGANLCGANLTGAYISEEQLAKAKVNWATILPNGRRSIF